MNTRMSIHVSAVKKYKSVSHVKTMVSANKKEMINFERKLLERKDKLFAMGANLYNQFRAFVLKNPSLFDSDFMRYENPVITDVSASDTKKAIKVFMKYDGGRNVILIPYLFIKDPVGYKNIRAKKAAFGDKTSEQIEKHYDGEIDKLMAEVERLRGEKERFTLSDGDWE